MPGVAKKGMFKKKSRWVHDDIIKRDTINNIIMNIYTHVIEIIIR